MEGQATATHVLPAEWYDICGNARREPSSADETFFTLPNRKFCLEFDLGFA
jgi:hypothetical protein